MKATYKVTRATTLYQKLDELVNRGAISQMTANCAKSNSNDRPMRVGDTLTIDTNDEKVVLVPEEKLKSKGVSMGRVIDTLVAQYAPDVDVAWEWLRKAHEMGWTWGVHHIGGPSESGPLGQRVSKTTATAFSNGAGVYVCIVIVSGEVRWGWFRAEEWGPRGRDLVLSGNRTHYPDPLTAMAEVALRNENLPPGPAQSGDNLNDVFGGQWDD